MFKCHAHMPFPNCGRLPAVAAALLQLDASTVATLTDPAEATSVLLQAPLEAWAAAATEEASEVGSGIAVA
jgi:hypothetical protein